MLNITYVQEVESLQLFNNSDFVVYHLSLNDLGMEGIKSKMIRDKERKIIMD